ncbi:MAG: TonB-dependent receptor [bacterium]
MKPFYFFIAFLFSAALIFSQSNIPTINLGEIVVSANRIETPMLELASSVTVITSTDIQHSRKTNVLEILKSVPGISIAQQGGFGKMASLFMRGANSNHVLIFVDGIEMNDPSSPGNLYDISSLQINNVEKIEIVRGPQSTLYGSDAIAGIINIFTKQGEGMPGITLSAEGGSNNFYRGTGSLSGSYDILGFSFAGSRLKTGGISAVSKNYGNVERDGYENNSLSGRLNLDLMKELKVDLLYNYNFGKGGIDKSGKTGDDPNYTFDNEEQIFKAGMNFFLYDGFWSGKMTGSFMKRIAHAFDEPDFVDPGSLYSFNKSSRLKVELQNDFNLDQNNTLTFGLDATEEKANTEYVSQGAWGPYESIFPDTSNSNVGVFIQDKVNFGNRFFGTVGIRYDKNKKFGGVATFRIAPAYFIRETDTKVKATIGTGFKAPSLFHLFDPMFGNVNLKPEKSFGFEFGFEQYFDNKSISIGATYFNIKYDELIGYDDNFKSINIDKALTQGIEVVAAVNVVKNLSMNFAYTYTDAKNKSQGVPEDQVSLLRRPKHQLNLALDYALFENLNINCQIKTVGQRDDDDFSTFPSTRVVLGSFTLVDAAISYKLISNITLFGRVENLFDRYYEEVLYYGTPGREFFAGAAVNF